MLQISRNIPGPPVVAAALLAAILAVTVPNGVAAQTPRPWWVHVAPLVGGGITFGPGSDDAVPTAGLQLEVSRALPIGAGLAGGWQAASGGDGTAERGGWVEALFAYRFPLRAAGRIAPYAGALAGIGWYGPVSREHFGGRVGVDVPLGRGLPFLRIELAYRHLTEAAGTGARDQLALLVGVRFSRALR